MLEGGHTFREPSLTARRERLLEYFEYVLLGCSVGDCRAHVRDELIHRSAERHQHPDVDELLRSPVELPLAQESSPKRFL